ncbi:MAG: HDIG domain-containing protein [Syntrophales bacterium]|nr:HDIG domain-containing protein [Syntrophales bacterium]MCK9528869.1 HDIG domain-containing protein [Syntrophales bacterium]MDX9921157.1 HDIG domain-containing protein [Syntrophales bacterium]
MNGTSCPIPDRETCYRIMVDTAMMEHIAAHSIQVCRVAATLADLLADRGIILNRSLVVAGALLHDITKSRSIETGENHAATGSEFVRSLGYPEVSRVVAQHVRLVEQADGTPVREEEIVHYADKRVIHTRIGSLADRLRYIMARYGTDRNRRNMIRSLFRQCLRVEERLFSHLDCTPEDLADLVFPVEQARELAAYRDMYHKSVRERDSAPGEP